MKYSSIGVSLLVVALGLFCSLAVVGCRRSNDRMENVDLVNVQAHSFEISSKSDPYLATIFYSIDQRKGMIYNARPANFETKVGKVKMTVGTFELNKISYAIGEGSGWEPWNGKDSVDLRGARSFRLKIEAPDGKMSKEYRVVTDVYTYDPRTITWEELGRTRVNFDRESSYFAFVDNGQMQVFANEGDRPTMYVGEVSRPGDWQSADLSSQGLRGRVITMHFAGKKLYIQTRRESKDHLYRSVDGKSWADVSPRELDQFVFLGAIQEKNKSEVLALARVVSGKAVQAVTLVDGELHDYEPLPESFPTESYAIFSTERYGKPQLFLLGGRAATTSGSGSFYLSSNGQDWFSPNTGSNGFLPASDVRCGQAFISDGTLFFVGQLRKDQGSVNTIYSSRDLGYNWLLGDLSLMLPSMKNPYEILFANVDERNMIYLGVYDPTDGGSVLLFKGRQRVYSDKK